ncbi:hypothetical protein BTA51_03980 [Hahella sp. CCB-MM4]|uniref:hypothetical protein n=1 Tax=Hahella sp. (strain CCB-MM4) TaxID=1926491 RepID=UPI000B9BFFA7|nr:hypothetical protein [Hahella sp. CCB-MM4]OZG74185.1 hypothetical protein BTA51_03980 [Hahella sp. CCB-MM4]
MSTGTKKKYWHSLLMFIILLIVSALILVNVIRPYLLQQKSSTQVTLVARWLSDEDCGEVCVPMVVESVRSTQFEHYIGKTVHPYGYPDLENFLFSAEKEGKPQFCISGYLHKYQKGVLRWFVVGANGFPLEVTSIVALKPSEACLEN